MERGSSRALLRLNLACQRRLLRSSVHKLTRAQVYECLAFYEDHRTAIDALVAEQMAGPGA